jgi:hypothetical protein
MVQKREVVDWNSVKDARFPVVCLVQAPYGHTFQNPGEPGQRPFAGRFLQAAWRKMTEAHHRLDDSKDWLD